MFSRSIFHLAQRLLCFSPQHSRRAPTPRTHKHTHTTTITHIAAAAAATGFGVFEGRRSVVDIRDESAGRRGRRRLPRSLRRAPRLPTRSQPWVSGGLGVRG